MQRIDGRCIYSASDLNNFLACAHLTALDRRVALGELARPETSNPQADILRRLGEDHERQYLELLHAKGLGVTIIERGTGIEGYRAAARATEHAMRAGAPVIYQAAFFHEDWLGYSDFLLRVDGPSGLGSYRYEVADTKLARHSEPYFLLQLCYYSEHVARMQEVAPAQMHVVLGDGRKESFDVSEFDAHYRAVKARFTRALSNGIMDSRPYPIRHCELCPWQARCAGELDAADHLSRVANIRRRQVDLLSRNDITTLAALANASPEAKPAKLALSTWDVLRDQAHLQYEQRGALQRGEGNPYKHRVLPADDHGTAARGLRLLPRASPGDVFFDMEGDPFFSDGQWFGGELGLEYLFGAALRDGSFHAFWGCDRGSAAPSHRRSERAAFEDFIDFVMQRRAEYPDFHIYHYAPYEVVAMKKLAERHRTREDEVDTLLREERFVDLFRVVRQSVRIGQPRYGIKWVEPFYEKRTRTGVKKGDDSIVEFERWLDARASTSLEVHAAAQPILDDIEQYNRFDCESTLHLLDWLTDLRDTHPEAVSLRPAQVPHEFDKLSPARELLAQIESACERLSCQIPAQTEPSDVAALADRARAAWLLRELLRFYHREAKPQWWEYFDTCNTFEDDPSALVEQHSAALGGIELVEHRDDGTLLLRYPAQQHKIKPGYAHDPGTKESSGRVLSIDDSTLTLVLKPRQNAEVPRALVTVPIPHINNPLVQSLLRLSDTFLSSQGSTVPQTAAFDVLLRRAPRLAGHTPEAIIQPNEPNARTILPLIEALEGSYLFIQGPPGSGKTQVAAELIVAMVAQGKRVGVAGPSHKAAHNLLDRIGAVALAQRVVFRGVHKAKDDDDIYAPGPGAGAFVETIEKPVFNGDVQLYSGTAWLFAAENAIDKLDYLFVDEAGQIALAAFLAMAPAARKIVLLGDPAQLSQIAHASHPGDVGLSVLEYLLANEPTVSPERGVFLTTSWRMHGDVCRFVSEMSYRARLHEHPTCNAQTVFSAGLSGAGLRYLPVAHDGNRSASPEEAERIADEIGLLLQGELIDGMGVRRSVRPEDIIVVTPYNAQRRLLERSILERTGHSIDVGTVNKFQGREAYVVFYSMATSSDEEMPRTTEFLFERNRLNVAISRARAMAVLVCSPRLFEVATPSIDAMRLINGLDRFVELATATPPL
jgi:predicted RecB family nuclease